MTQKSLVWFRNDLRLHDNFTIKEAIKSASSVGFIYVYDEHAFRALGGASKWWLHKSLAALAERLQSLGHTLHVFSGKACDIIPHLVRENDIDRLCFSTAYDPILTKEQTELTNCLQDISLDIQLCNNQLLFEPEQISNQAGEPYKVFTPFWRKGCLMSPMVPPRPFFCPKTLPKSLKLKGSITLDSLSLLPKKPNWAKAFASHWQPGELGAHDAFKTFYQHKLEGYKTHRDFPERDNVSRLSPHLHWGEIAPWMIWHKMSALSEQTDHLKEDIDCYLAEVGWREFSYYWLYHFPESVERNWKAAFDEFAWQNDQKLLTAWQQGKTGFPFIDAGMRQLWQSGWMHNRVRMVAASFLVKDLRIHWHEGEHWFWDTLVDADIASNVFGWQWVTGCGADAAPYFRIFNPTLQGQKFDPTGAYIRRWVPEISQLPDKWIHAPWRAPEDTLKKAGITLGKTYPAPIVDHKVAKDEAMKAYNAISKK